jgi:hypothetical protein
MNLGLACASAVALLICSGGVAQAYCRTSTCSSCARDPETGCSIGGTPIAWPSACVSFSMQEAASSTIELEAATALMREAFALWENARCGDAGEKPSIAISDSFGPAVCMSPQYNTRSGNANVVIFRDDEWPYSGEGRELAATWLTVDGQGAIFDADIEINATGPLALPMPEGLSFGVIVDQHDLLSIMVHETGHFLGLDHSREEGSVMLAELSAGEARHTLSADDEAAICAVYPPDRDTAAACDYTPRNGFAPQCTVKADSGCSATRISGASRAALLGWAGLFGVWRVRSARRRRPA